MPTAKINGIDIVYEEHGEGPALLMLAPGGFDSTIDKWRTAGVWQSMDTFETLGQHFRCIAYDRRESGGSGGRIEPLSWPLYADEGAGLLDHLGIASAFVMGGCMGCSVGIAFGSRHPEVTRGLILHWPVGGYAWKVNARERFGRHVAFVRENGLEAVVPLARSNPGFWAESRAGLWSAVLAHDDAFAKQFVTQDLDRYMAINDVSVRSLFDRDTAPGCEPEELRAMKIPALIMQGDDASHATSAAHYLRECLPRSEFWPVHPRDQEAGLVAEQIIGLGTDTSNR